MKERERLYLKPHQEKALDFILMQDRSAGLLLDMGLGKTAVVLKALTYFLTEEPELYRKVLVIAPKRVVESTWPAEITRWACFSSLTFSVASGTALDRLRALQAPAHIHLISRDNVPWFVDQCRASRQSGIRFDYDIVVIDELSSFKSNSALRFKKLRKVLPAAKKVIGMTGTPAPNGYMDLWAQLLLLSNGRYLGGTITSYRNRFFTTNLKRNYVDYTLNPGADREILDAISPVCLSMRQEDYVKLPALNTIDHPLKPSPALAAAYAAFKKTKVLATETLEPDALPATLPALTAASLANKLLQFCGGFVYDDMSSAHQVHNEKIEAALDLVEQANGQPVLIYYAYRSELDALQRAFPQASVLADADTINSWNAGNVPVLLAHPASAGHGLNLQFGGNQIIWYNMTYSLELYQQANKRLHRMGITRPVFVHRLLFPDWLDTKIATEVLTQKATLQDVVMRELRRV